MRRQELPSLHVDVSRVYEPADDTFLMLDALAAEVHTMPRGIALEIGSGSGCLSIGLALASKLGDDSASASLHLAVDLSPDANAATAANAATNGVTLHVVQMDLAAALRSGLIDVLIFNPPYVPTSTEEALEGQQQRDISAAWAGGPRGRAHKSAAGVAAPALHRARPLCFSQARRPLRAAWSFIRRRRQQGAEAVRAVQARFWGCGGRGLDRRPPVERVSLYCGVVSGLRPPVLLRLQAGAAVAPPESGGELR